MATKKSQKQIKQQALQKAISDRQMVRLESEASERRIAQLARQELKNLTAAAEKAEARKRAEQQFAEISRQAKGANKR